MNKYYHFEKKTKYNNLLSEIVKISIKGLEEMYLPTQNEFAMKKINSAGIVHLNGLSQRYNLINLIGLQKAESHGFKTSINLKNILSKQIEKAKDLEGIGEIGLLLWAIALISPEDSLKIITKIDLNDALNKFKDSKSGYTMELSWFLTGLLFASTFNNKFKNSMDDLPNRVYKKLRRNYGGLGIFKHENTNSIEGKLRSNIGTLADQVYPIYAFVLYSQQLNNEEALLIAKECAQKICKHQGKNGEWKWQYNSETGNFNSRYPIHSVHQLALAPLALFSIQMASSIDFSDNILRSLNWLADNEILLNQIIDKKNNAIWDKLTPDVNSKIYSFLNILGVNSKVNYKKIKIQFECSSYNFGWILYTFAGRINKTSKNEISEKSKNSSNLQLFEIDQN